VVQAESTAAEVVTVIVGTGEVVTSRRATVVVTDTTRSGLWRAIERTTVLAATDMTRIHRTLQTERAEITRV
jgi:hypothetical protein